MDDSSDDATMAFDSGWNRSSRVSDGKHNRK